MSIRYIYDDEEPMQDGDLSEYAEHGFKAAIRRWLGVYSYAGTKHEVETMNAHEWAQAQHEHAKLTEELRKLRERVKFLSLRVNSLRNSRRLTDAALGKLSTLIQATDERTDIIRDDIIALANHTKCPSIEPF